ncbi:MAG: PadR family transcriptional regulator [Sphingomonadales bacterium]|nr:PadR family transcriptional regulator [Sphingomonadales bacterium]MBD3773809.1 PadR family transcriptional regulator [Paracoccaceae bacterium]
MRGGFDGDYDEFSRGFGEMGHGFGEGFGGGFGARFEGGPGRGGRRRRMFGSGELRLVLLKLLADEPRHGYELIKAIEELTGGAYAPSPGVIYPTLSLLEDEGSIVETGGDSPRKAFAASEQGQAELAEKADEVEAILARLTEQGERAERSRKPEIMRAMGNLASVLRTRARSGRMDQDTVHAIVDLIDELAKKVERL